MPGFFEQAKKAMELRNKMKKVQRELENATQEYSNAGVKVVVTGDIAIKSVEILDDTLLDPAKKDKLVRTLVENANKAIHLAKDDAQARMKELTQGMGLGGMLG